MRPRAPGTVALRRAARTRRRFAAEHRHALLLDLAQLLELHPALAAQTPHGDVEQFLPRFDRGCRRRPGQPPCGPWSAGEPACRIQVPDRRLGELHGATLAPSRQVRFYSRRHGETRPMKRLLAVFMAVLALGSAITALALPAWPGKDRATRRLPARGNRRRQGPDVFVGRFPPDGCSRSTRRPEARGGRPRPRWTRGHRAEVRRARGSAVRERRPHWQGIRLRRERRRRARGVPADRPGQPTFINDVVLTTALAYFTDSQQPAIYAVRHGLSGVHRSR